MKKIRYLCSLAAVVFWLVSLSAHFALASASPWCASGIAKAKTDVVSALKSTLPLGQKPSSGPYTEVPDFDSYIKSCAEQTQKAIDGCWGSYKSSVEQSAYSVCVNAQSAIDAASGGAQALDNASVPVRSALNSFDTGLAICTKNLSAAPCGEKICSIEKINEYAEAARGRAPNKAKGQAVYQSEVDAKLQTILANIDAEEQKALNEMRETNTICQEESAKVKRSYSASMTEISQSLMSMGMSANELRAALGKGASPELLAALDAEPAKGGGLWQKIKDNPKTTAAIVGGAGLAGYMLLKKDKKDDDDDDDKDKDGKKVSAEQKEQEFQNGYAYNSLGERVNCLTATSYMSPECKPVMLNFCGKPEHAGMNSCATFNSTYCSASGASQSFCMSQSAKTYCDQPGPYTSANPSCQWLAARPTNCLRQPESRACLSSATAASLNEKCPSYPNDPLCKAFKEGKDVLQVAAATNSEVPADTSSLNSIVNDSGSESLASRGQTVNLLNEQSSALANVCRSGQLINCQ